MFPDVLDMRSFYNAPLGQYVAQILRKDILKIAPPHLSYNVMGLGYCLPFLDLYLNQTRRIIAAMPAQQGALYWPEKEKPKQTKFQSHSLLLHEDQLPFGDSQMDIVILAHLLEHTRDVDGVMEEINRVLAATGDLILITPNRRGLWAQFDQTPFGYGRPFSAGQMTQLLTGHGFQIESVKARIFSPPTKRIPIKIAQKLEVFGYIPWPLWGGILITHAKKKVYAPINGLRKKRPQLVWRPHLAPSPTSAVRAL